MNIEPQIVRADAVLAEIGHVCRAHRMTVEQAMARLVNRHDQADVEWALRVRHTQPHDPFEGV